MRNEVTTNARLSDAELLDEIKRLTANERQATARLIAALGELDARRLYLGEGCSSLFTYCIQVLHLSGWVATPSAWDRPGVASDAKNHRDAGWIGMVLRSFLIRPPVVAAVVVSMTACGPSDPSPPWDTNPMVRDLTSELQRFEGLATDFD
jgi:hypothetical protein